MADKTKKPTTTTTAKGTTAAKGGDKKQASTRHRITAPESWAKKQQRDERVRTERAKKREETRKQNTERKAEWTKKAQTYAKEYQETEQRLVTEKRKARAEGTFYVPAEAKVALIVRIRGINKLHPDVAKVLRLLRLRQIHNATFVRINKATTNMIKKILPYVTLGYPTRKTIRDLIYKRGYARIHGQRIPLQNNNIISTQLGRFGIASIEDLIHEITTVGPNFKEANHFLWPFKLSPPRGGYSAKRQPFHAGGDWGNREELINEFVQRMI